MKKKQKQKSQTIEKKEEKEKFGSIRRKGNGY